MVYRHWEEESTTLADLKVRSWHCRRIVVSVLLMMLSDGEREMEKGGDVRIASICERV